MDDPTQLASDKARLECEKLRAECDKIRAEAAELHREWWKRPAYMGALIPVLLGVFSILSVWSTGFFDAQRAQLRAEKEQLTRENAASKVERDALRQQTDLLLERNKLVQDQIDHGYVQLKRAVGEADYALNHVRELDKGFQAVLALGDAELNRLPPSLRQAIDSSRGSLSTKTGLLGEAIETLKGARESLDAVPASPWAKAVQFHPEHGAVHPDGSKYDPSTRPTTRPTG